MEQLTLLTPSINASRLVSKVIRNILESPEIAIVELIANSWDAGATEVKIHWPQDDSDFFSIEDNGIGMTKEDFRDHWCCVGYNRMQSQAGNTVITITRNGDSFSEERKPYGRNGIGKFAAFCFSKKIKIITKKDNIQTTYIVTRNVDDCLFSCKEIEDEEVLANDGTKFISMEREHISCTEERVIGYLSQRFVCLPNFDIYK